MEKLQRPFAALICVLILLSAQCVAACSVAAFSGISLTHSASAVKNNSHSCCHHGSDATQQGAHDLACQHPTAPDAETHSGIEISAISWDAVLLTGDDDASFSPIFPSLLSENWLLLCASLKSKDSPSAFVLRV